MKKVSALVVGVLGALILSACSHEEGPNEITVGTIAGPETQLMEVAKKVALKRYGLHVKIVTFTDYTMPNQALNDGNIDVNAFQHLPFLKAQIKSRGYHLVSVGRTFLFPMALYSEKVKQLSQLRSGDRIAIPNDPSNEARALFLLQKAKLIKLKSHAGFDATTHDILDNPKHFKFAVLNAAQLPRALHDVSLAAINTNYAIPAGLSPSKNALFEESVDDSPYVNIIAARTSNQHQLKVKEFVNAYHTEAVVRAAKRIFGDGAIAGFMPLP